ncbi:MAG: hypothetical protein V1882_00450 [Candidatus Omnitrophota bacterium]
MKPLLSHVLRDHVLLGALASLVMLPFYGWSGCALFFLANILIDLDHYAFFLWKTRLRYWDPATMFRFFEEVHSRCYRPEFLVVEPIHTVEIFALLALGAFFGGGLFVPVFAGFFFHAVVDIIHLHRLRILTKRCHSLIEYFWRSACQRRRGMDPAVIDQEAMAAAGLLPAAADVSIR